ncbi:hypothetical protein AAG906_036787 [Vitis piasezkii]|uniref:NAC domain-containing protein n=2 Tax=Vitis vinifera TaxID=29760 RepID=A0ABY9CEN9_VITVI|nr:NAC domain-containing protein 90 [Vitis vinifera]XP_034693280.1 NAC domain-containing protein 90-like [Vitis riparia]WJZ93571.1 hypothetical protein VitviT2T_012500 [Vitis vinifera]|eukprot:XP_002276192.1 PREDICTED: NAC domain-containing protein 90 [Vitis vinifera]
MEDMPPGFRFFPTEEELVSFYLHYKLEGRRHDLDRMMGRVIPVVDIYDHNPWDLPQISGDLCHGDHEWFFFIPRQEREARGGRPNRLTTSGYWKATGSPGHVYSSGQNSRIIGGKRTMVYYEGRAPHGRKTEWKMNEYKAIDGEAATSNTANPPLRQEFSLCRVYMKTKCLRAFDRRPSGALGREAASGRARGDEAAATSRHQNPQMVERTSSPESSSSSGDHANPSQTGESSNWEMSADNPPLWEWEQLNWF